MEMRVKNKEADMDRYVGGDRMNSQPISRRVFCDKT